MKLLDRSISMLMTTYMAPNMTKPATTATIQLTRSRAANTMGSSGIMFREQSSQI
jgi:hypothetical protein